MREAHFREGAGETEAVQESKAERYQPRIILRYVASLGWVAQQFACEEYDAKGNRRFDRGRPHIDQAKRGRRESDGMGDGEGSDSGQEHANVSHEQHQAEHKKKVIDAGQDVLHAELEISPKDSKTTGPGGYIEAGLSGGQTFGLDRTICPLDPHQNIGLSRFQPANENSRSREGSVATNPSSLDEGATSSVRFNSRN